VETNDTTLRINPQSELLEYLFSIVCSYFRMYFSGNSQ